jgi:anaerobic ribonucleoside-triphosphate reductase
MEKLKKRPCPECGEDMDPVDDKGTYFCEACDDHVEFYDEDDDDLKDLEEQGL